MAIRVRRIYEKPTDRDGARVLVDRLWPRGVSKTMARIDYWAKEIAPGNALRKWFHEDRKRNWTAFQKKYRAELLEKRKSLIALRSRFGKSFTMVTAAKDIERSHIPILRKILSSKRRNQAK